MSHWQPWRKIAETTAVAAGEAILAIYRSQDFDQFEKRDTTPVTSADLAADRLIRQQLPDYPVLSEESIEEQDIPYPERQSWERYWLVDPLDGTREFIAGSGEFAVCIALMEHDRPVVGVVHAPVSNTTWFAVHDGGAWKRKADGSLHAIQCKQLARDGRLAADTLLRIAVSRQHQQAPVIPQRYAHRIIVQGSSALKSCLVADGSADCYPRCGPTGEWDTAAAECIVREAGGMLYDPDGQPLRYNKPQLANPWFITVGDPLLEWTTLLPLVKPADQSGGR